MTDTANTIFGREAFLALLESEGVTHLFGNPGTTELPIMAALPDRPAITVRHGAAGGAGGRDGGRIHAHLREPERVQRPRRAGIRERNGVALQREVDRLPGSGATPMSSELAMLRIVEALPKDALVIDEGILSSRALPALYPCRDARALFGLDSGGSQRPCRRGGHFQCKRF